MTKSQHYDAIVVGLGGVGSFTLRALAKGSSKGRFLGVELGSFDSIAKDTVEVDSTKTTHQEDKQTKFKEAGFSSRGLSRIYRRAYFEHANYVPWIEHSLNEFREMEKSSGLSLMKECGMLLIEPALHQGNDTEHMAAEMKSSIGQNLSPLITSSLNSAKIHNVPVELLDSAQLMKKFPQFNYSNKTNMFGLLEPGEGLLRPERIMKVALQEATLSSANVTVMDTTSVSNIKDFKEQGIVEVHLLQHRNNHDNGATAKVVTTNKLLVCAGAWTGKLIPTWDHFLYPVRQVQGWININTDVHDLRKSNSNMFSSKSMPAFVYISPDWPEGLYGVPCDDDDNC